MNQPLLDACPLLPRVSERFRPGNPPCPASPADAYHHRLSFAQSLWLEKKPAQALLQLNHAFTIDLEDGSDAYRGHPWPYKALVWMVSNLPPNTFIGNPVRHYQHYATRIPPDASLRELRSIRAWICFHLMRAELPAESYPTDEKQIVDESILVPATRELLDRLTSLNRPWERDCVEALLCRKHEGTHPLGCRREPEPWEIA